MTPALQRADPSELAGLPLFEAFTPDHLAWLVERSEVLTQEAPGRLFTHGEAVEWFYVLLDGELALSTLVAGRELEVADAVTPGAWAGDVATVRPRYRMTAYTKVASRLLRIRSEVLVEMLTTGIPIAPHLLAGYTVGGDNFTALVRDQEKLAALGRLSAGLAHEINNPAAAAARAADRLRHAVAEVREAALAVPRDAGSVVSDLLAAGDPEAVPTDALDRADAEREVAAWVRAHGVAGDVARLLVEAGLDPARLEQAAAAIPADALGPALRLAAADHRATALAGSVAHAAGRVSDLVLAMKEYSYRDAAPVQDVDLVRGLENTLTILSYKLKRGVRVVRDYASDVPAVPAHGSELNQVWTNLIDNAIDAMSGTGTLTLAVRHGRDRVEVDVIDDGPGIPEEVRERMFEAFFTTKPVGEGSGLGLDIVRRIVVDRHHGDVSVESRPGRTRFTVTLPLQEAVR